MSACMQAVRQAVEGQIDRLVALLQAASPAEAAALLACSPDDAEAAALGAPALAFFRNRASAPRDMSGAAVEQLRAACDALLMHMYV